MPLDPFDILGLPPTFDLTREQIERAYLAASRRLHPDLVGAGPQEQAAAQASSARLNEAAGVLRDPEARASALVARLGGPSKEADKSLPDGFLQDILDVRMEIEAARGDPAARDRWEAWAGEQRLAYAARCSELLGRAGATTPPDAGCLREARRTLNAWRYIERLIEQLDA
jgi:molecular chaperone HscB